MTKSKSSSSDRHIDTRTIHHQIQRQDPNGAILPPLYQTATYVIPTEGESHGNDYTRCNNPTRAVLENTLADLEGVAHGVSFSSGLSAVDACLRLLDAGDHLICGEDVYGGVIRLVSTVLSRAGITATFVDTTDSAQVEAAIQPNTKLLWFETPSNPLLNITSVKRMSEIAKAHNLILGVDSTFATPYLLRPAEYGVDLVVHSTTKYLSGHNQVIGGAVLTDNAELYERLKHIQKTVGAVSSPFDCWLTLLGLKTFAVRMERHCANALAVAEFLEKHSIVKSIRYPGLKCHPGHELATQEMSAYGGMISLELNLTVEETRACVGRLKLFRFAESLGAVESMITHPASMTHASVPREERLKRGLTDGLIRLSVGIERVEDLIADLDQALTVAKRKAA